MPLTFSHPAAVLPLQRVGGLHLPALILGSMLPDLGYYIRYYSIAELAHTVPGGLLLGVPVGFLLLALFYLLRQPMADLLPEPLRTAVLAVSPMVCPGEKRGKALLLVTLSLGAGILTHILWDDFTHFSGRSVQRWEIFRVVVLPGWPLYRLLQHASSLIGGLIVLVAVCAAVRRRNSGARFVWQAERERLAWLASALLFSIAAASWLACREVIRVHGRFLFDSFCFWFVTIGSTLFLGLFLLLALVRAWRSHGR